MIRLQINNNGTSPCDLFSQWLNVSRKAGELIQALEAAAPHGRDYQTNKDPVNDFRVDRGYWELHLKDAQAVRLFSDSMLEAIHTQAAERNKAAGAFLGWPQAMIGDSDPMPWCEPCQSYHGPLADCILRAPGK